MRESRVGGREAQDTWNRPHLLSHQPTLSCIQLLLTHGEGKQITRSILTTADAAARPAECTPASVYPIFISRGPSYCTCVYVKSPRKLSTSLHLETSRITAADYISMFMLCSSEDTLPRDLTTCIFQQEVWTARQPSEEKAKRCRFQTCFWVWNLFNGYFLVLNEYTCGHLSSKSLPVVGHVSAIKFTRWRGVKVTKILIRCVKCSYCCCEAFSFISMAQCNVYLLLLPLFFKYWDIC